MKKIVITFIIGLILTTVASAENLIKRGTVLGCNPPSGILKLPSLTNLIEDENGVEMAFHRANEIIYLSSYSFITVSSLTENEFKINPEIQIYGEEDRRGVFVDLASYVNLSTPNNGVKLNSTDYEFDLPLNFRDEDYNYYSNSSFHTNPKYQAEKTYYSKKIDGAELLERVAKIKESCSYKLRVPSYSESTVIHGEIVEICNNVETAVRLKCLIDNKNL